MISIWLAFITVFEYLTSAHYIIVSHSIYRFTTVVSLAAGGRPHGRQRSQRGSGDRAGARLRSAGAPAPLRSMLPQSTARFNRIQVRSQPQKTLLMRLHNSDSGSSEPDPIGNPLLNRKSSDRMEPMLQCHVCHLLLCLFVGRFHKSHRMIAGIFPQGVEGRAGPHGCWLQSVRRQLAC